MRGDDVHADTDVMAMAAVRTMGFSESGMVFVHFVENDFTYRPGWVEA